MNWWKRNIGSWRKKTSGLNATQKGAYGELLDEYYATGKPIEAPAECPKSVAYRICCAIEKWERDAVDTVLAKFFTLTDRGWTNARAEAELARYRKATAAHISNLGGKWPNLDTNLRPNLDSQIAQENSEFRIQKKEKSKSLAAKPPKRATQFPDDFQLNAERRAIAASWGIANADDEWTHFESHHRAKGSRFVDWHRAWITWCCRSIRFSTNSHASDAVKREAMVGASPR